jgi:tetratricopeptide (TPR) repeat protein
MRLNDFENDNLPKVNPNENLETLSGNLLRLIFPAARFEIRSETERDKGIDFHIELKKEIASGGSAYTNFRFAVQLKATQTAHTNTDESLSLQISSSNISYLLNNGMPAYYILYHQPSDHFYYENVLCFLNQLQEKDVTWQEKEKHSLRFSKLLNPEAVSGIYEDTYRNGLLLRKINQQLKFSSSGENTHVVLIDTDHNVYSTAENIEYIEQFGADLINRHYFNAIIQIEQRSHPRSLEPARFNLFCGIAYFQLGNLYKAMELLKKANREIESFEPNVQAMLTHTILNGKYLLGMMSKENFDIEMQKVNQNIQSGTFFHIERAYDELSSNRAETGTAIKKFYDSVKSILEQEKNSQIRTIAYNRILMAESIILIYDLTLNFTYFIGRVREPLKTRTYLEWLELERSFLARLSSLTQYALKCNYYIGAANLTITRIKWNYEKSIHTHYLSNWSKRSFDLQVPISQDMLESLRGDCVQLDKTAAMYEMLEFKENVLSCWILKFQMLHLAGELDAALTVRNEILDMIEKYEFEGLRNEYTVIFNNGTAHELFVKKYTAHINQMQDFGDQNGINMYSPLPEELTHFTPTWSIEHFFEFELPDPENGTS